MVRKCHQISNRGIPSPWGREARTGEKGIKTHPPHTMSMRAITNNSSQSMHLAMTTSRIITIRFAHFCKEHWTNYDLNFRLFRIGVCKRNCNFLINQLIHVWWNWITPKRAVFWFSIQFMQGHLDSCHEKSVDLTDSNSNHLHPVRRPPAKTITSNIT